ncbi:MAG: hypothetical protein GX442_17690 [Candidatus Riflebacteria bacterium]|nr:hypothetical protein [Candidatus Riflebacteria bacterium]
MIRTSWWQLIVPGLILGLVLGVSLPAGAARPGRSVGSRECKILLRIDRFADLAAGLRSFWSLVETVARGEGMAITPAAHPTALVKTRFVAFYDTPGFDFYRRGYMLRRRAGSLPDVVPPRHPQPGRGKFDLTLKFRSRDLQLDQLAVIEAAGSCDGETKVEEDVVAGPATIRKVFSLSSKVALKKHPGAQLRDYLPVYPGLARLGLPKEAPITPVRDVFVREDLAYPGRIDLDGATGAEATFSVWSRTTESRPFVVEFSFKYDVRRPGKLNQNVYRAGEAADRLLRALQQAGTGWISTGKTKTAMIYQVEVEDPE